ncbi:hypothetical protein FZX15_08540 [Brucella suis bv. 1]|nr:hypothetical protein FZX15_08540 [Brucella suis bv. 1]
MLYIPEKQNFVPCFCVPAFRAHPEKCETVFGKDARQNKGLERRSDSIRSKRALIFSCKCKVLQLQMSCRSKQQAGIAKA